MAVLNPYANVNWQTANYISSASHTHMQTEDQFWSAYNHGLRHFATCNYGLPWNPQDYVQNVPSDVIVTPNTELHDGYLPFYVGTTGLGSNYSTESKHHGMNRKDFIDTLNTNLKFDGLGAFAITHPLRATNPTPPFQPQEFLHYMIEMLDYHPLVALEVYNASTDPEYNTNRTGGWADGLWDLVLATGRQCFGHFNPDHMTERTAGNRNWRGRNILLTPEWTEIECLKAYANGAFFGSILDDGLVFNEITLNEEDKTLYVKTNEGSRVIFITDKGRTTVESNEATFRYTDEIFIRVESKRDNDNPASWVEVNHDRIFSQPIILKPLHNNDKGKKAIERMLLIL